MNYKEFSPDKRLTDFVKCYWRFENGSDAERHFTILPDGCFDLIVSLNKNELQSVSLTGIWKKPVDVSISGTTVLFGIRFKLLAAGYILQQSIAALCDSETELKKDVWGINEIDFTNSGLVFKKLDAILLSIAGKGRRIDNREQRLFGLLY